MRNGWRLWRATETQWRESHEAPTARHGARVGATEAQRRESHEEPRGAPWGLVCSTRASERISSLPACGSPETVDLILHGGKVVTVDPPFSVKSAIAVQDGKIGDRGGRRGNHSEV